VDGTFYAYATGDLRHDIQVSSSTDLVHWAAPGEALSKRPSWQPGASGLTWSPEVARTSAGYVMYYTARDERRGRQCVTDAVAAAPSGPFVDDSNAPLVCRYGLGGSIDPGPFRDLDGTRYLLWKNDGNCCGQATHIYLQALSADGLKLLGEARDTGEVNDRPWEANLVEGPTLVLHDGTYFLFYSANDYDSSRYAVGYATSRQLFGPYADAAENPILLSRETAAGPGGQTIVKVGEAWWILYHAWDAKVVGDRAGGQRSMWLDQLVFHGDTVSVDGPDVGPQPAPVRP
jgi:beta-xylosidase